ncbi:uncharacterized protein LOC117317250 [Pecten maximus]|uniref:uncharacterized protein LOC117317250 n=1 Tax=Pecten maximus TaxID=6579 RepID=UPI001458DB6E|nr:uncharacterized protein LOC117317250 [Pecten maximus]XP_033727873.1 uncharacterized protein LOC117317250 [Pecten maximus]
MVKPHRMIQVFLCLVFGVLLYILMRIPIELENNYRDTEEMYVPLALSERISDSYPVRYCTSNQSYVDFGSSNILTSQQKASVEQCIASYQQDHTRALEDERSHRAIRYTNHSYLNRNSVMIEVGGHLGIDVSEFNSRYHPGLYFVLEPVPKFYNILVTKFKEFKNVVFFNFGIDVGDGQFYIKESSDDAVSIFESDSQIGEMIQIVNTTQFFETLSVRSRDVDLITMNCEGCEYAVLDLLLTTDYIRHFRNIQFQSHRIERICYPIRRFCWYQELLRKTHKLSFQFRFVWENWTKL